MPPLRSFSQPSCSAILCFACLPLSLDCELWTMSSLWAVLASSLSCYSCFYAVFFCLHLGIKSCLYFSTALTPIESRAYHVLLGLTVEPSKFSQTCQFWGRSHSLIFVTPKNLGQCLVSSQEGLFCSELIICPRGPVCYSLGLSSMHLF